MNQERLFDYLENQKPSVLLELLDLAFDEMNIDQKHDVFGKIYNKIPADSVDAEQLLADIELFYELSLKGHYYAPFNINSKNFSDVPEKTEEWFEEIGDYLEDSSKLSDQKQHKVAIQCFKLLHKLIDKMLCSDEIIFAHEYGTWMITGDEKRFVKSYLTSLSAISTPEEYATGTIPLIKQDSYESFSKKVYSTAIKIANEDQKTYLKKVVKKHKIRTKSI